MTQEAEFRRKLGLRIDANKLAMRDNVYAPVHREILAWLEIAPGAHVLDAGCGAGGVTVLLAETVGAGGSVAAVDIAPTLLATTRARVEATPYASRVTYHENDIASLPFANSQFDLVWCSRVIHDLPDQLASLRELFRVLKPGGRIALREQVARPHLLPFDVGLGRPGLEDRVNLAYSYRFVEYRRSLPDVKEYALGWLALLREAGFGDVTAHSFLLEMTPPFTEQQHAYLLDLLRAPLELPRMKRRLDPKDEQTLTRLTDPEGPFYVFNRSDLHYVSVSTVYVGYARKGR